MPFHQTFTFSFRNAGEKAWIVCSQEGMILTLSERMEGTTGRDVRLWTRFQNGHIS